MKENRGRKGRISPPRSSWLTDRLFFHTLPSCACSQRLPQVDTDVSIIDVYSQIPSDASTWQASSPPAPMRAQLFAAVFNLSRSIDCLYACLLGVSFFFVFWPLPSPPTSLVLSFRVLLPPFLPLSLWLTERERRMVTAVSMQEGLAMLFFGGV